MMTKIIMVIRKLGLFCFANNTPRSDTSVTFVWMSFRCRKTAVIYNNGILV